MGSADLGDPAKQAPRSVSELVWVSKQTHLLRQALCFLIYKCPGSAGAHFGLGWTAVHQVLAEWD